MTYSSDLAIADVPGATYDALRGRFSDLATVVDAVSAERKALWDEIRRREVEVAVKLRLGALTDAQKLEYKSIINSPTFTQP
ncbi:MAG: hypothetical protein M0Z99_33900 [Betaproteobacteria bacterium]|nr:hypothetical protein [Betaproteobacteria bacterium]